MLNEESKIGIDEIVNGIESFEKRMIAVGDSLNQKFAPFNEFAQTVQLKLDSFDRKTKAFANYLQTSSLPIVKVIESLESGKFPLFERIEELQGAILNLPLEKWITAQFNFNLNFESITSVDGKKNHFNIAADIEIIRGEKSILLIENERLNIEVLNLQQTLTKKEKVILAQQSQIEEMGALNKYYLAGGSPVVQVHEAKFLKQSCELKINEKIIKIKYPSRQYYLCSLLFKNKSLRTKYEIGDFAELIDKYNPTGINYKSITYQTVRHLNDKIFREAGISNLIICDSRIYLNPKHLEA